MYHKCNHVNLATWEIFFPQHLNALVEGKRSEKERRKSEVKNIA